MNAEQIYRHILHVTALDGARNHYNLNALVNDWYDIGEPVELKHSLDRILRIIEIVQSRGIPVKKCVHVEVADPNWVTWRGICQETGQEIWDDEPCCECEDCGHYVGLIWINCDEIRSIVQADPATARVLYREAELEVEAINQEM